MQYLFAALLAATVVVMLLAEVHERIAHPRAEHLDFAVQAWVHARANPALTPVMEALTRIGSPSVDFPICAVLGYWLWRRQQPREAVLLFGSLGGAGFLILALKLHFKRARPDVPWRLGHEHSYSFPSGHSMAAVVLYGTLLYILLGFLRSAWARLLACTLALLLALSIGYSRIYLGAHWPTDVLAGYLAGSVWLVGVVLADWSVEREHPPT